MCGFRMRVGIVKLREYGAAVRMAAYKTGEHRYANDWTLRWRRGYHVDRYWILRARHTAFIMRIVQKRQDSPFKRRRGLHRNDPCTMTRPFCRDNALRQLQLSAVTRPFCRDNALGHYNVLHRFKRRFYCAETTLTLSRFSHLFTMTRPFLQGRCARATIHGLHRPNRRL